MNLGQYLIIGFCLFLVAWYIGANSFNRSRGIATYRWLRRGLDSFGEITEAKWLGSSGTGARLAIPQAHKPFRRLEAVFLLETREILPYWILSRLWGRRDVLTIKADLHRPPKMELAVRRNQKRGKTRPAAGENESASHADSPTGEYKIIRDGQEEGAIDQSLATILTATGDAVESLFLHKDSPHFELNASIRPLLAVPPEAFFSALDQMLRDMGIVKNLSASNI